MKTLAMLLAFALASTAHAQQRVSASISYAEKSFALKNDAENKDCPWRSQPALTKQTNPKKPILPPSLPARKKAE